MWEEDDDGSLPPIELLLSSSRSHVFEAAPEFSAHTPYKLPQKIPNMADAFSSGQFVFPSEYGYVIWAGALTFVINFVQTFYIGQVRTHS